MTEAMKGGCACGKARFAAKVAKDDAYLCHCRMCQRATGSVSIALTTLSKADVVWEAGPDWYQSSPIARRPYCAGCGTSLGFEYVESDKTDLAVAAFDDPSRFRPKYQFGMESAHRAWLNTEGVPESRTGDYAPLVERWEKAIGRFPG